MAYAVSNPLTGKTGQTFPTFDAAQVEHAVAAADRAHREWSSSTTPAQRGELLRKAAQLHRDRRDELADLIVEEMGKIREGALGERQHGGRVLVAGACHGAGQAGVGARQPRAWNPGPADCPGHRAGLRRPAARRIDEPVRPWLLQLVSPSPLAGSAR